MAPGLPTRVGQARVNRVIRSYRGSTSPLKRSRRLQEAHSLKRTASKWSLSASTGDHARDPTRWQEDYWQVRRIPAPYGTSHSLKGGRSATVRSRVEFELGKFLRQVEPGLLERYLEAFQEQYERTQRQVPSAQVERAVKHLRAGKVGPAREVLVKAALNSRVLGRFWRAR